MLARIWLEFRTITLALLIMVAALGAGHLLHPTETTAEIHGRVALMFWFVWLCSKCEAWLREKK